MIMADVKAEYLACPIRQVVSRFGDKWSMLVLYMLHTSETGLLRFNEIRRLMTDCSQKMLSATLKNLEQSHLVHREVYPGAFWVPVFGQLNTMHWGFRLVR